MHVRRVLATLAVVLGTTAGLTTAPGSTVAAAAATGDPSWEHRSAAVVTRLTLDADGRGWLTVSARLASAHYGGWVVSVGPPRTDGTWVAPDSVPVPGLDVDCVRRGDADTLVYDCGSAGDHEQPGLQLPTGRYPVTIPVQWTGPVTAYHQGNVWLQGDLGDGRYGDVAWDAFTVRDASEPRTTAEVGAVELDDRVTTDGHAGSATVVVDLDVAAGESVTFVDVDLPYLSWRLDGTNAPRLGLDCWVRPSRLSTNPSVHCRSRTADALLPAGRYSVVLALDYTTADYFPDTPLGFDGYVRLGIGNPPDAIDKFSLSTPGPW